MPRVNNHGISLNYDVLGSGPDLLLIAGTSADLGIWGHVRPALARHFRTIAFDNRDSGGSSQAPDGYTIADLVGDTIAVMDAAESPHAHVLGHSLGGVVAQELALAHPERLKTLTLANSWARRDTYATSVFELALGLSRAITDDALRLQALYFIGLGTSTLQNLPLSGIVNTALDAGPAQPQAALQRQWQLDLEQDTSERLHGITASTHVIWSTEDKIFPKNHAQDLIKGIDGAVGSMIEGAGHCTMIEKPEAFVNAVLTYLKE